MSNSAYKVVELIGTSEVSWEQAVKNIVSEAAKSIRDIRHVEVVKLDARITDNQITLFRARINLSFKFEAKLQ